VYTAHRVPLLPRIAISVVANLVKLGWWKACQNGTPRPGDNAHASCQFDRTN